MNNDILNKWLRWIEILQEDTQGLLISHQIYKDYMEIIKKNKNIQKPDDFHRWVRNNYASSMALHVRRQLDTDNDSISLKRLLTEIKKNPKVINRTWHRTIYKTLGSNYADMVFKQIAGDGEYFDSSKAEKDIQKLDELGKNIELFATRRLAHKSKRPIKRNPTFNDLDDFITQFEQLVIRYILLFTATGYDSLTPVWQYDWTNIFLLKWIEK